jgi:FAD/FMN-containing dehydrogenase
MHKVVHVRVADLMLDASNPRLGDNQKESQPEVYAALARQQGKKLVALAADIVRQGELDPTSLPAVVAAGAAGTYRVLEGNRRVLALKALETPSILDGALDDRDERALRELATEYRDSPIEEVACVLFDSDEEAWHWIDLRHTGENDGAGLVEWNHDEKDRAGVRHGKPRSPGGQVVDFVDKIDGPSEGKDRILTTVQRVISDATVRRALGIAVQDGVVLSAYPAGEVIKGLRKIVADLRDEVIKVKDVYDKDSRAAYLGTFEPADLPDSTKRLPSPVPLGSLSGVGIEPPQRRARRVARSARGSQRGVVPQGCPVNPGQARIKGILDELATLPPERFPNAVSVLMRVFLELSVDHAIDARSLLSASERRNKPLARRMKVLAADLEKEGAISDQLRRAIEKVADAPAGVSASSVTFNQYVHNQFVYPKPMDAQMAWDELQPLFEAIWP